jgi:hypothetical protein
MRSPFIGAKLLGSLCFAAWTAALCLVACEGNVIEPCPVACERKYPNGVTLMNPALAGCACQTCTTSCSQSFCVDKEPPTGDCLSCAQYGLSKGCKNDGFFKICYVEPDCAALVACITSCPAE